MTPEHEEELRRLHADVDRIFEAWQGESESEDARNRYIDAVLLFSYVAHATLPELLEEIQRIRDRLRRTSDRFDQVVAIAKSYQEDVRRLRALLIACRVGD